MSDDSKELVQKAERVKRETLDEIEQMLDAYPEAPDEDMPPLDEYGLGFDYVPPGTFRGQREGYWRYQIAWGGPAYEIRYFGPGADMQPVDVSFAYLDWFTGREMPLEGHDLEVAMRLWDEYLEPSAEFVFNEAAGG